ncbi:MAG: hypothetical protein ACOXZ5_01510 [Syntrophomonadaceae bacterium]|jgi:DNA-binding protein YbaB
MKRRWGKGEPVNLSDLLKITPVANEIMQLSEELEMSSTDVMWIVSQIIGNTEDGELQPISKAVEEDEIAQDEWEDIEMESLEEDLEHSAYMVNVKITGNGRFPEIGFKAGVNDKEDINYFFDMIMDMMDKLG